MSVVVPPLTPILIDADGNQWKWDNVLGTYIAVSGGGIIHQTSIELTDAQIKALPTTAVEILGALGADKAIVPIFTLWILNNTAAYTNLDATLYLRMKVYNPIINYSESDNGALGSTGVAVLEGLINQTSALGSIGLWWWGDSNIFNAPLQISADNGASGDLTGGDAANTLKITVAYMIFNLSTGRYE